MDSLFQQAKAMYPNASDEEINQNLMKIRQEAPDASDEEILKSAQAIQGAQQSGEYGKIAVRQNLMQKYGLGDQSAERQKLVQANNDAASPIAAAFAGFGAGLRGGDVASGFNNAMKASQAKTSAALDAFDKARDQKVKDFAFERDLTKADREDSILAEMRDPNSERSKAAQQSLIEDYGMSPEIAAKLTAEQAEARLPGLKHKLDREMKKREFSERQKDRALQREYMLATKNQARQDKLEKEAKLSDKQIESISSYDKALDSISSIRSQKAQFDTGPLAGRWNSVAQMFGTDDAAKTAFRSEVQDQLAQYIKSISGGAVSDSERAALMQNLPNMNDNDETFMKKLDALEKRIQGHRQTDLDNYSKGGKNVSEFESHSEKKVVRTGKTKDGRKVVEYSDGTREVQ